ncbi:MAG: GGDEF domain-containing protein, partial [Flavobacteriaceae bacterium]|nr:GGDEF domain-containing protein [Flavobacteriaceae bacterium]
MKINTSAVSIDEFKMGYFIDESEKMPFDQIQKQKFIQGPNNLTLGTAADVTWVKIILVNDTNSSKKLFLHNAVAYHSEAIHFYEMEDNTLINDLRYEPRHYVNTENMDGAEALYTLTLEPGQTKSIYMQSHFLAYQLIELSIYDQNASIEDLVHRYMPIVILFSILTTLALYYFILYVSAGYKEYVYYSLYLISSSIFIAYCYGMVSHYFHLYGEWGLKLNALAIVSPIFLALFIKSIFKTKENYPLQNKFINSIIVLFSLTYLYSFFEYYQAIEFTSVLFVYFLVVMLWVSISLYKKNAPLVKYFFIAHISYLIFSFIAILFYNNGIAYNYLTSHSIAIGTMFEALILGFLVSSRIRLLESDNKQKEQIILIDPMTSLYNKSHFEERLQKELLIHRRDKTGLTLMIIDIDYFKEYNDTYGHLEGDKTLKRVAKSLQ